MIINLFCDASIDIDKHVACAGCYISAQDNSNVHDIGLRRIIQTNATNNSSEILAIWIGVVEALRLRSTLYPNAVFRLFSDSKISLYGLRDWLKNWVNRMDEDGVLLASNGQPVMNQQRFIDIFNIIVENNLKIELYHQRGHVLDKKMMSLIQARAEFIKANKVPPENLGIDISYLCNCNQIVDNVTREAVRSYVDKGIILPYTEIERCVPMDYLIRKDMLHNYIRCINKTSIQSYHDFKGGYRQ